MSEVLNGSWFVRYEDGTEEWQHNANSPQFSNGEVPYRAIDWPRVRTLVFESQYARREFAVSPLPPGYKTTLHSRHFWRPEGVSISCFLVVVSHAELTPKEGAVSVFYWFPDDTTHDCHLYDCPDVGRYGGCVVNGQVPDLAPEHGLVQVQLDAATGQ